MPTSSPVLSVRVSASERELLESAAAAAHTSLSDFVRRRAIEAAEMDLLARSTVTIPAAAWEQVEAWVSAPAKDVAALRDLVAHKPAWRD